MNDIPFHPLAHLFPLLEGAEYAEMVEDIRAKGLNNPIVLYEGQVLDGRNRFRACKDAGVEPHFEEYAGDDPAGYVWSQNYPRRHLTTEFRKTLVAKLRAKGMSERQIAKKLSVPKTTVHRDLESGGPGGPPDLESGAAFATPDQSSPRITGRDGKSYPASRPAPEPPEEDDQEDEEDDTVPPASPKPPKPEPRYPHSDLMTRLIDQVCTPMDALETSQGGIKSLTAEPKKWDRARVREFILPQLKEIGNTIAEYIKEIEDVKTFR